MPRLLRLLAAGAALALGLTLPALTLPVLTLVQAPPARAAVPTAHTAQAAPAAPSDLPSVRGAAARVAADVDDFTFRSMDVDYTLSRTADGASRLRVVETFTAIFPDTDQNRGMRRSIPDRYNGQPLFPTLVSITDGHGTPRAAETDTDDGTFTMTSRADGYVHGPQTYVFTYTLENVTYHFADTGDDEFYWDVNGVDWAQPFGSVTARLHVEAGLATALTGAQSCYRGAQGATDTCEITAARAGDAATITAHAERLFPHQTMTIAVGFSAGTFTPFDTSYLASPWGWLQAGAGAALAAVMGITVGIRRRALADEPGRPTVIAEYTPPAELDALHSAVLLGKTGKAIPAELLEQAIAGTLRIHEGEGKRGDKHMRAEFVTFEGADDDGRMLLRGMFGSKATPGKIFTFGKQSTRFSNAAQKILRVARSDLRRRGLYRKVARRTRSRPIIAALVCGAAMMAFGIAAMAAGASQAVPALVAIASLPAVAVVAALCARRPKSAAGAEARDHLYGLKLFIEWAEADRIRMLQSPAGAERVRVDVDDPQQMLKIYEPLLPYAVVFGQEKQWAQRLAVLYGPDASPTWYDGQRGFSAAAFSAGIRGLSATATVSVSVSGGSSGGGFAGGGGGGGGGGGV